MEFLTGFCSRVTRYTLQAKQKVGFTLVEIMIVIAAVSIALPVVFGLFFVTIQSRTRVAKLQATKQNGDYALNVIQSLVRKYARATYSDSGFVTPVCNTTGSSASDPIYFSDAYNNWFTFNLTAGKIASESSITGSSDLTSDAVAISGFSIGCDSTSSFSPPIITVQFKVSQAETSSRQEEKAELNYQTKIKLRSY